MGFGMNSFQKDDLEKGVMIALRFVFWSSPQWTDSYILQKVGRTKENLKDSSLDPKNPFFGVLLN